MAIIIPEEAKSGAGILSIITWLVVVGAVAGTAYFIFFKKPELVGQIVAPASFKKTEQLSKIDLNPQAVVGSLSKSFRQYIAPLTPGVKGRANPFIDLSSPQPG
ncbi:MAG: hypothetical protein Q7S36_00500 [Candidatus Liptonbacteria bacterium]|nr:hypothetical protein [Candidatus Liptonbacteria bacterium]